MSDRKGWGSTVLGWFVVHDEAAAAPAPPDDGAVPEDAPGPPAFVTEPPAAPGGRVDFPKVYAAAGVDADEQGRVDKAAELLGALPAATDAAVKKQIVEASLRAFGIPIDKIIEAGVQAIQALEGYIRAGASDTQKVARGIREAHRAVRGGDPPDQGRPARSRTSEQAAVVQACNEKKLEVQKILEFFGQERWRASCGLAEARSTRATPSEKERMSTWPSRILQPPREPLEGLPLDLDLGRREGAPRDRLRERDQLDGGEVQRS